MTIKKIISEAQEYPFGYGIAYYDYQKFPLEIICYPIILNKIIYYLRQLYFFIARGKYKNYLQQVRISAFEGGRKGDNYTAGYKNGYRDGYGNAESDYIRTFQNKNKITQN